MIQGNSTTELGYIVGGHVYYDVNGNGLQEISEPNPKLTDYAITDSSGVLVSEIVTNAYGEFGHMFQM